MATQLVKKKFGGKRKGYKGETWSGKANRWFNPLRKGSSLWQRGNAASNDIMALIMGMGMLPMKKGGRVRGVRIAKRGLGKVMRKK